MARNVSRRTICGRVGAGAIATVTVGVGTSQARESSGPVLQTGDADEIRRVRGEFFSTAESTLEAIEETHSALTRIRQRASEGGWDSAMRRFTEFEFQELIDETVELRARAEELLRSDPDTEFQELMRSWFVTIDDLLETIDDRLDGLETAFSRYEAGEVDAAEDELEAIARVARNTEEGGAAADEQLEEGMAYTEATLEEHAEREHEQHDSDAGSVSDRGFFTNDAASDSVLNDPFTLTVTGFILSAVGILYQLVSQ